MTNKTDVQDQEQTQEDSVELTNLDKLKAEATELNLTFSPNIAEKTLAARIEKHYKDNESPAVTVTEVTDNVMETAEARAARADLHMRTYARKMEADSRKTRVVTITDNDQRVNNATTTCSASCSNSYFDLGTIILPLNEKVEVRQGHIDSLAGVKIPHHVRSKVDPSMSETVMRPRYAIHYEPVNG